MKQDIIPIEQLLAQVRAGGELFDGSVDVDELGERVGDKYVLPVDDPDEIVDEQERREGMDPRAEAEEDAEEEAAPAGDDEPDTGDDEAELTPVPSPRRKARGPFPHQHVYGEGLAYAAAWSKLEQYMGKVALRIAAGDAQLADDLLQEARIELWEVDPSRFDEADQMYLKRVLVTRMIRSAETDAVKGMGVPRAKHRRAHRGGLRRVQVGALCAVLLSGAVGCTSVPHGVRGTPTEHATGPCRQLSQAWRDLGTIEVSDFSRDWDLVQRLQAVAERAIQSCQPVEDLLALRGMMSNIAERKRAGTFIRARVTEDYAQDIDMVLLLIVPAVTQPKSPAVERAANELRRLMKEMRDSLVASAPP